MHAVLVRKRLSGQFSIQRVLPACRAAGEDLSSRESVWLVIERPDDEPDDKYYFANIPGNRSKKRLLRLLKERWRTERVYEDLEGELGFDHYEGRRYSGWHHHVSVDLCCYAFVTAKRARLFPLRQKVESSPRAHAPGPERHFSDSFITMRLAIARELSRWLPRCPTCHRPNHKHRQRPRLTQLRTRRYG